MTTIGIIGAGEVGSQLARAAIASGYTIVIANSRGPETLTSLVEELGPSAQAASAAGAAEAGEFVIVAVPLRLVNDMPAAELAGKVVIDVEGGQGLHAHPGTADHRLGEDRWLPRPSCAFGLK